ncbi:MAG TPA: hypothetical protein VKA84_01970 [Gemmatimonadaceae bacterium]|nr:hypothetical protein [Gemmatimonadaceae bacterium]
MTPRRRNASSDRPPEEDAPAEANDAGVTPLTSFQLESWRLLHEELLADRDALAEAEAWEARRAKVRPEMLKLLRRYLAGSVTTEELRATVDRKSRTTWDVFGLRGLSGAMFLNRLVARVPDERALTEQLRAALPAPDDELVARGRLRAFVRFLDAAASAVGMTRAQLQPARAAFFASVWWHVQQPEEWPGFHLSARRAMQMEDGLYLPGGDPVSDYFAFRAAFRAVAGALGVSPWRLEYLCWWRDSSRRRSDAESELFYEPGALRRTPTRRRASAPAPAESPARPAGRAMAVRETPPAAGAPPADAPLGHTHVQWLLAKIGRKLGCRVWIAANDRGRVWNREPLGTLSVERMPPLAIDADTQRLISLIDVVWLRGSNQVAAAFEVEHTTSVFSGLLRMADLAALSPNLNFPLYIVAPADRLEKVRRELMRPTFQTLELHRRCAFFSSESLVETAESIMRWATGPAAIDRLAERIEVGAEETTARERDEGRDR